MTIQLSVHKRQVSIKYSKDDQFLSTKIAFTFIKEKHRTRFTLLHIDKYLHIQFTWFFGTNTKCSWCSWRYMYLPSADTCTIYTVHYTYQMFQGYRDGFLWWIFQASYFNCLISWRATKVKLPTVKFGRIYSFTWLQKACGASKRKVWQTEGQMTNKVIPMWHFAS